MRQGFLLTAICALAVATLAPSTSIGAQDQLAAAKELYRSAAFDDALTSLEILRDRMSATAPQRREVERYRAFCLIALGRNPEAAHAIEAILLAEPAYHPSDAEVSPRVGLAFRDIRRRILPSMARGAYAAARGSFDRKEYGAAATEFARVLTIMEDAEMGSENDEPSEIDLRLLAEGFGELSRAHAIASQR
jgi:hypothetical protein